MTIPPPLVSIITPVYNAEPYLEFTIRSVLNQKYQNWEMIIIDDRSTDRSVDIMKQFAKEDIRLKLLFMKVNSGSGIARNAGIAAAKGKYIAFLDSDDIWRPEKLIIQVEIMESNKWNFTHSSYGYINSSGQVISKIFKVGSFPVTYSYLLKKTDIGCLTAIYNCEAIGKFYMSEHRRKQDYALWLSILKTGQVSYPINEVLAYYRQTPNSATRQKWKLFIIHIHFLMKTQSFSIFKATYYTIIWSYNGVKKWMNINITM